MTNPCGAVYLSSPGGSIPGKFFPAGTRLQVVMGTIPKYI